MITVTNATIDDFALFKLHPNNIKEIEITSGLDPDVILAAAFELSTEKFKVTVDGKVQCLFGIINSSIWFLFDESVNSLPLSFFKVCRQVIKQLAVKYGNITGLVYSGNPFAIKWAKFMGFALSGPTEQGNNGGLFYGISYRGDY